jgi:hypothetical protein
LYLRAPFATNEIGGTGKGGHTLKYRAITEGLKPGLTTGNAPFVEAARSRDELYIDQAYDLYTPANHECWRRLWERMRPRWERYANGHFLKGIETLQLPSDRIPRLADVNRILRPMTGFQTKAVSGYAPAFLFFDCLRRREFPTTITIRPGNQIDYLPEPDIFHDVAGHVPMHTEKAFADTLVLRRLRPHRCRNSSGHSRREGTGAAAHQHHQSYVAVLLVLDRVRPYARAPRDLRIWQRTSQFPRRIAARRGVG